MIDCGETMLDKLHRNILDDINDMTDAELLEEVAEPDDEETAQAIRDWAMSIVNFHVERAKDEQV